MTLETNYGNIRILYLLILIFMLFSSCSNGKHDKAAKVDVDQVGQVDKRGNISKDLKPISEGLGQLTIEKDSQILSSINGIGIENWSTEDLIITESAKSYQELQGNLNYWIDYWKNVESPSLMKYGGSELGDYFHLNFITEDGLSLDFAKGNNEYGKYSLYSNDDFEPNDIYVGKTFKVLWEWKPSRFACCGGSLDLIEAYHPSITELTLVE